MDGGGRGSSKARRSSNADNADSLSLMTSLSGEGSMDLSTQAGLLQQEHPFTFPLPVGDLPFLENIDFSLFPAACGEDEGINIAGDDTLALMGEDLSSMFLQGMNVALLGGDTGGEAMPGGWELTPTIDIKPVQQKGKPGPKPKEGSQPRTGPGPGRPRGSSYKGKSNKTKLGDSVERSKRPLDDGRRSFYNQQSVENSLQCLARRAQVAEEVARKGAIQQALQSWLRGGVVGGGTTAEPSEGEAIVISNWHDTLKELWSKAKRDEYKTVPYVAAHDAPCLAYLCKRSVASMLCPCAKQPPACHPRAPTMQDEYKTVPYVPAHDAPCLAYLCKRSVASMLCPCAEQPPACHPHVTPCHPRAPTMQDEYKTVPYVPAHDAPCLAYLCKRSVASMLCPCAEQPPACHPHATHMPPTCQPCSPTIQDEYKTVPYVPAHDAPCLAYLCKRFVASMLCPCAEQPPACHPHVTPCHPRAPTMQDEYKTVPYVPAHDAPCLAYLCKRSVASMLCPCAEQPPACHPHVTPCHPRAPTMQDEYKTVPYVPAHDAPCLAYLCKRSVASILCPCAEQPLACHPHATHMPPTCQPCAPTIQDEYKTVPYVPAHDAPCLAYLCKRAKRTDASPSLASRTVSDELITEATPQARGPGSAQGNGQSSRQWAKLHDQAIGSCSTARGSAQGNGPSSTISTVPVLPVGLDLPWGSDGGLASEAGMKSRADGSASADEGRASARTAGGGTDGGWTGATNDERRTSATTWRYGFSPAPY
eukprot:gene5169-18392_t